jgi:hypothetical protein
MRHVAKDAKIAALIFSQLTLSETTTIPTRANIRECKNMANGSEVILIGFETKKQIDVHGQAVDPREHEVLPGRQVQRRPARREAADGLG